MALARHRQEGIVKFSGAFSGGTSPAVTLGKGFSVAYDTTVYTVTLIGETAKAVGMVVNGLTIQHASDVEAGDATVPCLIEASAANKRFKFKAMDVAGTGDGEALQADTVVHFEVTLYTTTPVV